MKASDLFVNALENADRAFFVDGDNGDDSSGDGSMENPFATIGLALGRARECRYLLSKGDWLLRS